MDQFRDSTPVLEQIYGVRWPEFSTTDPPPDDEVQTELRPGPGLPESLGWIILFFGLQIFAMIIVLVSAILLTVGGLEGLQGFRFDVWLKNLGPTAQLIIMASPALLCYLVLIPLGLWRMAPRPLSQLNLSLPTGGQVLLASSLVLPLTMVADATMKAIDPIWLKLVSLSPAFETLNNTDVHKMLAEFGGAWLPVALFLIAVVPGIGEEFLFRGLIGRGLVARWGLVAGVFLTSFLFAAVHMYPPHVMAIIPVGIALHWIYLTTKSFWAPVLFHFLNNAISTILMRAEQSEGEMHWSVIAISVAYFGWCLYWLYQMRTRYHTIDGPVKSPGHAVAPPAGVTSRRISESYTLPVVIAVIMILLEIYLIASAFFPQ